MIKTLIAALFALFIAFPAAADQPTTCNEKIDAVIAQIADADKSNGLDPSRETMAVFDKAGDVDIIRKTIEAKAGPSPKPYNAVTIFQHRDEQYAFVTFWDQHDRTAACARGAINIPSDAVVDILNKIKGTSL